MAPIAGSSVMGLKQRFSRSCKLLAPNERRRCTGAQEMATALPSMITTIPAISLVAIVIHHVIPADLASVSCVRPAALLSVRLIDSGSPNVFLGWGI